MPPVWPFVTSHSPLCTPPRVESPRSQVLDDRHPAADRSAGAVERRHDPRRSVGHCLPSKTLDELATNAGFKRSSVVEQLDDQDRREHAIHLWSRIRSDQEVLHRVGHRVERVREPDQVIGAVELDEGSVRYALRHVPGELDRCTQVTSRVQHEAWARSPSGAHDERRCSSRPGGTRWPQPDSPRCAGSGRTVRERPGRHERSDTSARARV